MVAEIKKQGLPWEISWIGSKQAVEGKKVATLESKMFPGEEIKFYSLFSGRLQRRFTRWTIPSLLKIPLGFVQAFYLILKIKPRVVVSFGGFAAFPVVVISFFLGIPIIIHEQTAAVGRSNRYSAIFAKLVLLSREESKIYLPKKKTLVIGNPIRAEYFQIESKKSLSNPPNILIVGGSRGSMQVNRLLRPILSKLLERYRIVHQVGPLEYEEYLNFKNDLSESKRLRYEVLDFVKPSEMVKLFEKADLIVSRAGANSVSEIIAARRRAVLIPIPWAYLDEQKKNAELAQKLGLAEVVEQNETTPEKLLQIIDKGLEQSDHPLKIKSPDILAAERFVEVLKTELR